MDDSLFRATFDDIVALNASEGPRSNIFEPKFEARGKMLALQEDVVKKYTERHSVQAMLQMCRCLVFMAVNMMETDEESDGAVEAQKAYHILQLAVKGELVDDMKDIHPFPLEDIIRNSRPFISSDTHFTGSVEFLRVHNALGLYLSTRSVTLRVNDAKQVLLVAQKAYKAWHAWFSEQPASCVFDVDSVDYDGKLVTSGIPEDQISTYTLYFEMGCAYTSTLFFLTQVFTANNDVSAATEYCYLTLYHQLLYKQEFCKKDWASHALHLSEHFCNMLQYGEALHCLLAGRHMMPAAAAADGCEEESLGAVAWAFGRYHLHRLEYYGKKQKKNSPDAEIGVYMGSDWVNFPLDIPGAEEQPPLLTFDEARETFKAGYKEFQEALLKHPFQTSCIKHIDVSRDIGKLYAALAAFETDGNRIAAMLHRQIDLIEQFPDKLNFNAYPTLIRQLLYDLGELKSNLLDVRLQQRQERKPGDKVMSGKAMNELVSQAKHFFARFCDTWRNPSTGEVPEVLDEDSRECFLRVLVCLGHLELKYTSKTYEEEYKKLGSACDAFKRVLAFAAANSISEDANKSVEVSRKMVAVLADRQRQVIITKERQERARAR